MAVTHRLNLTRLICIDRHETVDPLHVPLNGICLTAETHCETLRGEKSIKRVRVVYAGY